MKRYMVIGIMMLWSCTEVFFGGYKETIKASYDDSVSCVERHYDWKGDLTSEKRWEQESWD